MKKIVITGGRYGYISPSGVYDVKTTGSAPFEVDDNEAARLVKLGVAKIHGESGKRPETGGVSNEEGSDPTEDERSTESETEDDMIEPPEYSTDLSVGELRAIAKKVGISFKVGTTKEDMVAMLDEYFKDNESGDSDNDEFPLQAEDPVG